MAALETEIVGVGSTEMNIGEAFPVQVPFETVTEYEPLLFTVILCVVAPVDHKYEPIVLEVNVAVPPEHRVVEPNTVIVGELQEYFAIKFLVIDDAVRSPKM